MVRRVHRRDLHVNLFFIVDGISICGDGTSHKNEHKETKFATINMGEDHVQFFLGIQSAINHTSETQMDGWIEVIEALFKLAVEAGISTDIGGMEFWKAVTGFHSDHAADQKKLFELLKKWKQRIDREGRGVEIERSMDQLQHAHFVLSYSLKAMEDVGTDIWDLLAPEVQARYIRNARVHLIHEMGQEAFDALPEAEKKAVDFFLWAGCCMHKEMNTFKAGCTAMTQWWNEVVGRWSYQAFGPLWSHLSTQGSKTRPARQSSVLLRSEDWLRHFISRH